MPLEDLVCAGCGAPLKTADAEGRTIACPYCKREHVFVAPPPEPSRHEHPVGSQVAVQWGGRWWTAEVLGLEGPDRWRIHYVGWSSSWDEVVGPERIRPAASAGAAVQGSNKAAIGVFAGLVLAGVIAAIVMVGGGAPAVQPTGRAVDEDTPLSVGQPVQVEWGGSWYEAHIRAVHPDGRVRVHYEGWENSYDEDVSRDRVLLLPGGERSVSPAGPVATPQTELRAGQPIQIEWMGVWYDGTVLASHPDGHVRVHYDGWSDDYDEDVPRTRVRVP